MSATRAAAGEDSRAEDGALMGAQTEIHALDAALTVAREAVRAKGAEDAHYLHLYFTGQLEWLKAEAQGHDAVDEIEAMIAAFEALDAAISEPIQTVLEV